MKRMHGMDEMDDEKGNTHLRGWCCMGSGNRFGFGFWLGLFFLGWGVFEIMRMLGYFKDLNFPFWPLILIIIGLSMVLKRV
jgi:hypothetical protein